jgi:hydrogenase maturation protease
MTDASAQDLIIGVGNAFRGDDGAGLVVAQRLRSRLPPDIRVLEQSGEGTALMDAWREASRVIVIDAVHSGAMPGTIHRIDVASDSVPTGLFPASTHAFGVVEAVAIARALQELPPRLIVYGIEGADFGEVQGLSEQVHHAVVAVADQIVKELQTSHNDG